MSFYFRFEIPTNADGSTVTYSPGWCGTHRYCADKETGIYYNDKERWGIAIAEGTRVPPDVEVIDAKTALTLMGADSKQLIATNALITMDKEGVIKADGQVVALPEIKDADVYYGAKLATRYSISAFTEEIEKEVSYGY